MNFIDWDKYFLPSVVSVGTPTPYFQAAKKAMANLNIKEGLRQVFGEGDIKDYVSSGSLTETAPGDIHFVLEGRVPTIYERMFPKIEEIRMKCLWGKADREVPEVKNVYINGRNTTVEWVDGTKTTVAAEPGIEVDEYAGLCAAFCKKIYGTREIKNILKSDKVHRQRAKSKKKKEGNDNG